MKAFLNLQPRYWKEIYSVIMENYATKNSEELSDLVKQHIINHGFSEETATTLANKIIPTMVASSSSAFVEYADDEADSEARLSLLDIKLLKEKLLHEPSPEIRRLLVTLLVYARANPHPSFWIKYDRKVIFFLASLQKLKVSDQILLTNRLHTCYNLDMQVVGSNQPTPCFKLSWQADEPPIDDPSNGLVLIGPLNPATIKAFADQLPYEEEEKIKAPQQSKEVATNGNN